MGLNPGSVNFFFSFFYFFSFFLKYILHRECFRFKYCPPPPTFFHFLIVQYLFVHCTIPSILESHRPYPTSPPTPNIAFTTTLTPHQPNPPPDPLNSSFTSTLTPPQPYPHQIFVFIFLNFHKNFNSSFTSTLTPLAPPPPWNQPTSAPKPPDPAPSPPPPPLPAPPPKKNSFFEFSQKLQFFVDIHPVICSIGGPSPS